MRLLMILNSVLAGIIVARWLGAAGVGELAVINVSVSTLVQLGSAGLPSANTFFIARDNNQLKSVACNSLVFALVVGTLLAAALTVLAGAHPDWFGIWSPGLLRIAAISLPFQLITLIGLNIFLALGQVRYFNLLDLGGQSFVLINTIVALILVRRGLLTLVTLNTAASILIALIVVGFVMNATMKLPAIGSRWRVDLSLLGELIRYGLKFHISIIASALIFRADLLVVNHFRGAAEAGVYGVASQVAMMLILLPGVIATLLFPRITAQQDVNGETTCLVMRHTALILMLACLAAIPLSFALPLLYGPGFTAATMQLLILLPGIFLVGLESVLVQHFNALGLPRIIPIFWLATLALNVAMVFVLVPRMGANGAAIASSISYAMIFILVMIRFRQSTNRSLSDVLLLRARELAQLLNFRSLLGSRRDLTG